VLIHHLPSAHERLFIGQSTVLLHLLAGGAFDVPVMQVPEAQAAVAVDAFREAVVGKLREEVIRGVQVDGWPAVVPAGEDDIRAA